MVIDLPARYRADLILRYLGRDSDSLCERVEGNRIDTALLTIRLEKRRAIVDGPVDVARRLLGLVHDSRPFERAFPDLVAGHEGAHLPQTASVWESLMWAIVGQ